MNFSTKLFFIFALSIFFNSCGTLVVKEKTPVQLAQENFKNLEDEYEELLSFNIHPQNLENLQKKYKELSLISENILLSKSSENPLSRREISILNTMNITLSTRFKILEDLKD